MTNAEALQYWKLSRYTPKDVIETSKLIDDVLAARFDFFLNTELSVIVSNRVNETRQGHFPCVVDFVKEILSCWEGPAPKGSLLIWLEDGIWLGSPQNKAPIFAFGRNILDNKSLLLPDPAFIGSNGYRKDREEINQTYTTLPWSARKPTAFWRGASSGCHAYTNNWREAPRVKLALISKEWGDETFLDAKITKVVDYPNSPVMKGIFDSDIITPSVPFSDFLQYRYLIDVDGESCAWKSLFLKLASGSVVFKVNSNYLAWYYDRIKPWEHYIPIASNLSDLHEKIVWANAHDSTCKEIAHNAKMLMDSITFESEIAWSAKIIEEVLRYGAT